MSVVSAVIRKYDGTDLPPILEPMSRGRAHRIASTRLLQEIIEIEKKDKEHGDRLMSAAYEFKRWVELQHERKLREEGRLT